MKNILIVIIVVAIAGIGAFIWYQSQMPAIDEADLTTDQDSATTHEDIDETVAEQDEDDTDDISDTAATERPAVEVIGRSAGGSDITVHHFGTGEQTILFVGGVHGGYTYNTSLLAYQLIDHLEANPALVPDNVTVSIIPILNPDGIERVTGAATRFSAPDVEATETARTASRFNANNVDLNRNFDCQWHAEGTWRDQTVSGGSAPFSEPEARAVQGFVQAELPVAVVTWYAAAGEVFASACGDEPIMAETQDLMNTYASASGYPAQEQFTYYTVTGDMMDWLASNEIPAISVLLSDRESTEWSRNRAAIEAILTTFGS